MKDFGFDFLKVEIILITLVIMEVRYASKKLQKCAENEKYAQKELGRDQAEKFLLRVGALLDADSFENLRHVPGHFHELSGNRKGQWAFDLNQPYRLIVTPQTLPIPTDNDGKYIWYEIRDAVVVEIVNYHKEG